jgi:hypothetical protein
MTLVRLLLPIHRFKVCGTLSIIGHRAKCHTCKLFSDFLHKEPLHFGVKSILYILIKGSQVDIQSLIVPRWLSIEVCYSALAPYQGNVFLHWLRIR